MKRKLRDSLRLRAGKGNEARESGGREKLIRGQSCKIARNVNCSAIVVLCFTPAVLTGSYRVRAAEGVRPVAVQTRATKRKERSLLVRASRERLACRAAVIGVIGVTQTNAAERRTTSGAKDRDRSAPRPELPFVRDTYFTEQLIPD